MQPFFSIILGRFLVQFPYCLALTGQSCEAIIKQCPRAALGVRVSLISCAFGSYKGDLQREAHPICAIFLGTVRLAGQEHWPHVSCSGFCPSFTNHPLSPPRPQFLPSKRGWTPCPFVVCNAQVPGFRTSPICHLPLPTRFIVMQPNNNHLVSLWICAYFKPSSNFLNLKCG